MLQPEAMKEPKVMSEKRRKEGTCGQALGYVITLVAEKMRGKKGHIHVPNL